MAASYSTVPSVALKAPEIFHVAIPEQQLSEFKTLLKLSKIPAPTYESLQEDGRYGISHKWLTETKKYWEEEFDWYAALLFFDQALRSEKKGWEIYPLEMGHGFTLEREGGGGELMGCHQYICGNSKIRCTAGGRTRSSSTHFPTSRQRSISPPGMRMRSLKSISSLYSLRERMRSPLHCSMAGQVYTNSTVQSLPSQNILYPTSRYPEG